MELKDEVVDMVAHELTIITATMEQLLPDAFGRERLK